MKSALSYILISFTILFWSCGKSLPTFQDVDITAWRSDRNACNGTRTNTIEVMSSQKNKFLGLSENDIVTLLGRPDNNELYKRNQKFYYYQLQPSSVCKQDAVREPLQLVIRFNAMGLAKEVSIQHN